MTTNIKQHGVDKVTVKKTTQNGDREVEKVVVTAGDTKLTVFGSYDEDSSKDATIDLEIEE